MKRISLVIAAAVLALPLAAQAQEAKAPTPHNWSWDGIFGSYDKEQLRRGLQIFRAQCTNCHGLTYVHFRDLAALGLSEDDISKIAASYTVPGPPDDNGDPTTRPAKSYDAIPSPFPNEQAAKAAYGAAPPDLSLQAKAHEGGPDFIASLLTGYSSTEPDSSGLYHNPYIAGGNIHMPPPLYEGLVTYTDGTKATMDQMSQDIASFLMWAAEPHLEARKRMGLKVVLFLLVLTGLFYVSKRKIWADVEH
jgi:ubiquinol-cytochrome c reductase cytochrome c1 subunit